MEFSGDHSLNSGFKKSSERQRKPQQGVEAECSNFSNTQRSAMGIVRILKRGLLNHMAVTVSFLPLGLSTTANITDKSKVICGGKKRIQGCFMVRVWNNT